MEKLSMNMRHTPTYANKLKYTKKSEKRLYNFQFYGFSELNISASSRNRDGRKVKKRTKLC